MSTSIDILRTMTENTDITSSISSLAENVRLYNSQSHKVEPFVPLSKGKVGMYVCGATVQSDPHVGHLRSAVSFDVIRRWFMKLGFEVTFIRNVTDIDDKILKKAADAGQQWWARAYFYEQAFTRAYNTLGVLPPTYEPRATGHIGDMVDLVERLIQRGHAYVVSSVENPDFASVYFDVQSWDRYGSLTHQETGVQQSDTTDTSTNTVENAAPSIDKESDDPYNPQDFDPEEAFKRNPRDFALWKASKISDPTDARWRTPFGTGRPGWHIECSAMSHRYLGDAFDIHGGGLDLRFPHHENEMAQSQAAGWDFAKYWMHTAWVTAKGEKMSKSLGTGLSVDAVLEHYTAWAIRYAMVSVQYRSMLEWCNQTLDEATSAYERITTCIQRASEAIHDMPSLEEVKELSVELLPHSFVQAMNDDFNIALALGSIFSVIRETNGLTDKLLASNDSTDKAQLTQQLRQYILEIRTMLDTLGLDPYNPQWQESSSNDNIHETILDSLIGAQIEQRAQARRNKDFATADAIRNQLAELGIELVDQPTGTTWKLQ